MNRQLYTLLFYLALPLVFFQLLWRSRHNAAYRHRWGERLGRYRRSGLAPARNTLVFHTVSVGELHAALPLIKACCSKWPDIEPVVTTTTVTGSERVRALLGDSVRHCYMPYDLPGAVRRFLRFFDPALIVVMETELWPNLIHFAGDYGARVMIANARLSGKSLKNYRKASRMTRRMLGNLDLVAAQFESDAENFRALGLPESALEVVGTMKFDIGINTAQRDAGRSLKRKLDRPVLVAGSTRDGEERKVLAALRSVLEEIPDVLLVLVPRHPERFDEVAELLRSLRFRFSRYSRNKAISADIQVLLGDSLGEMQFYYSLGDLAFVGGSLVDTGCQNIIEPAALGLPVLTGPSLYNFHSASEILRAAGAMNVVNSPAELAAMVLKLIRDDEARQRMSRQAAAAVSENRGATERLLELIAKRFGSG